MASKPGVMYDFPWEPMGNYKYLLLAPFAVAAAAGLDDSDDWCRHMVLLVLARYVLAQLFVTASRIHAISGKHRIQKRGVNFEQMDREDNWDDFLILQALVMTAVHWVLPGFANFPLFSWRGLAQCALLHAGPTEFVYYWFHRALHNHALYGAYHSHHHKSFVTEPTSGSCHPFMEHLGYTANFAIPMLGTWMLGGASIGMFYFYTCAFDVLNLIGHCNWEFVPARLYQSVPLLKYLVYTPSYHSLHHSRVHTNFCLFMPFYDWLGGTLERESDGKTWTSDKLQMEAMQRTYEVPDAVFLAHGTDLLSGFHLPMFFRGFAKNPYKEHWLLYPLWPLAAAMCAVFWAIGSVFTSHVERVNGHPVQTWVTPRYGFQYFLGFEKRRINRLIEQAIRDADRMGVKVFGLGALNKAEHVNGGGAIFPKRIGEGLRTRVVHGNTLTAACLLREFAPGTREVFLTGATSKLGRAAALWLCRRGVRVRMLTSSRERYEAIRDEAAPEHRHLLVQCTSHSEGGGCKTWIVGKLCGAKDQACAPPGTHFHQVVVPPIEHTRSDCTYGELAAMDLPPTATDVKACELFMPRRRIFACHAGALTHMLEGWKHHEVGPIDVDRIDVVWEAALRHGFTPAVAPGGAQCAGCGQLAAEDAAERPRLGKQREGHVSSAVAAA